MTQAEILHLIYRGKLTDNPMPQEVSTGRIIVGTAATPLASIAALGAGQAIGFVLIDPYAPITHR